MLWSMLSNKSSTVLQLRFINIPIQSVWRWLCNTYLRCVRSKNLFLKSLQFAKKPNKTPTHTLIRGYPSKYKSLLTKPQPTNSLEGIQANITDVSCQSISIHQKNYWIYIQKQIQIQVLLGNVQFGIKNLGPPHLEVFFKYQKYFKVFK